MEINIFDYEPHKDEHYFDEDGKRITLECLCKLEPLWAANVIRILKNKLHEKCCGPLMESNGPHNALRIKNGYDLIPEDSNDNA